ncbi:MAG: GNAT family N-acetyltransferase [Anaerolineae bacterium]
MNIRLLTVDDAQAFRDMRLEALLDSPEAFGWSYEEFLQRPMNAIVQQLADATGEGDCILGAFDGKDLVGITGCYRRAGLKERHKGYIWGVYVSPQARRRGIARQLMTEALSRARRWPGVEQVHLTVVANNTDARSLYVSLGFTSYGIEPHALKIDGRYYDEEMMVLAL